MTKASITLTPEVQTDDNINIGLPKSYRREMAESLSDILAHTYQLTIKSHLYHWNVVGPLFKPLHDLTESHYEALFEAADIIAERVRALGHLAPISMNGTKGFAPTACSVKHTMAIDMVKDLISDHESAVSTMRKAVEAAGEKGDVVTEDMLTARLTFHEKTMWMLRAIIAE